MTTSKSRSVRAACAALIGSTMCVSAMAGLTANGLTANGLTANGLTANGLTANGLTANGLPTSGVVAGAADKPLVVESIVLPDGTTIRVH